MKISEIVTAARALLQDKGRASYRLLKMEFALDEEQLDVLREELIDIEEVAADKDGKMLVWVGDGVSTSTPSDTQTPSQSPASYTPQHLAERILAEQAAMESRGSANGERKTITALFADLKGSTALIEGLDPEDARAIIDPALQLMMDAVHRYDGYVAQALGDGIFALFGAPIAHEDHPQRALYAALRMQEEMREYSDQVRLKHGVPLQMRVGINTGEVVVRSIRKDDLHTDYVPVGHSTNLAARMEQIATPGSIVVSEYTRKLTEGYFELKALGAAAIKGVEEPLNVYEVVGAGPLRTRLQVSARRGLTRFVGRQSELDQMQRALEEAKAGHGQIVGVMGEPGLGKSRLFYEFKLTSQSDYLVLAAFSVSYGKASPYLPLIELLKTYFQIEPTDDERTRKEKVGGKVFMLDRSLEDTLPYLFSLLGIEDEPSTLRQMDAQMRRRQTFDALKRLFLRESLNQPLLLLFEDLHWIDSETQGFLDTLSESVASAQLLLLVNYRPEYRHDWGTKTYYTQLRLTPLGKEEAEELLTSLLGSDTSLTALKPLILERTEGTPFFMEEVVQTLAEEGVLTGDRGHYRLQTTPTELNVSTTVQGVLAARIDRLLPEEKALLQQLSVIGRQFPVSLVQQVVAQPQAELSRLLSSLQAKEFLYEQPAFPEVEYLFKHALTQDVAYDTVLQAERKVLHEQTGHAMEMLYAGKLEDHYSDLAHHYAHSANAEKAVEYLYLAGQQAVQRSAHAEAVIHLTKALELLTKLPDGLERAERELRLQLVLGPALMATKSYTSSELEHAYTRALKLCHQIGNPSQHFHALWGLWITYLGRGVLRTTREFGEQLVELADKAPELSLQMPAHLALGEPLVFLGELLKGRAHLEQAIALYDPHQHAALRFLQGQDPGAASLAQVSNALWLLGYPEQAQQAGREACALAQEVSHPNSEAYALTLVACVHLHCGGYSRAQQYAEASLSVSTEHELMWWTPMGSIIRGWTLMAQRQPTEGIAQIQQGIEAYKSIFGPVTWWPYYLGLLADAYGKVGQATKGLKVVAEALERVDVAEERWSEAELYRLRGKLMLQQSPTPQDEAAACFHTALEMYVSIQLLLPEWG